MPNRGADSDYVRDGVIVTDPLGHKHFFRDGGTSVSYPPFTMTKHSQEPPMQTAEQRQTTISKADVVRRIEAVKADHDADTERQLSVGPIGLSAASDYRIYYGGFSDACRLITESLGDDYEPMIPTSKAMRDQIDIVAATKKACAALCDRQHRLAMDSIKALDSRGAGQERYRLSKGETYHEWIGKAEACTSLADAIRDLTITPEDADG